MDTDLLVHSGEDGWSLAEALERKCYPPEVMATIVWRDVTWAHADMRFFVRSDEHVLTHVGLYFRVGKDGDAPRDIVGIGAVMTDPGARRQGHASTTLRAVTELMKMQGRDFGLLFCEPHNVAFYEGLGWRVFDGDVFCEQPTGRIKFDVMHTMVLPLRCDVRSHVIDLCGLPW